MTDDPDIRSAFEKLGGWKRIVKFANASDENFAKVLMIFGKQLAEAGGSHAVSHDDGVELHDTMVNALKRIIDARDIDEGAVTIDGVPVLDTPASISDDANSGVTGAAQRIEDTPVPQQLLDTPHTASPDGKNDTPCHGIAETPAPQSYVESVLHEAMKPKPKLVVTPPVVAAPAPLPAPPRQPATTELFLQWEGHQRPTWSAPRSWSGW